jgi:hypothetical protein
MGSHPFNLAIRFLLEIAALVGMGVWGLQQSESAWRYLLAIGIPVLAATVWGMFAVPDDPSRSGSAPVAVPGIIRLIIEFSIFAFAIWAFIDSGYPVVGIALGVITGFHYIFSYDRVAWLIKQK